MEKNIFLILGVIGAITLITLWIYWKISDFIISQKTEIKRLNDFNAKLIEAVNNHAECLLLKKDKEKESIPNSALVKILPKLEPLKITNNESN